MNIDLLTAENGSTITLVNAFSGLGSDRPRLLGQGSSPSSVDEGDVNLGLNAAIRDLGSRLNLKNLRWGNFLASSSAAGGLKMSAHGLVYNMTVRAAREAVLGAGANLHLVTAGRMGGELPLLDWGFPYSTVGILKTSMRWSRFFRVDHLPSTKMKISPEPLAKRTVEGDLGLFENRKNILNYGQPERLSLSCGLEACELVEAVNSLPSVPRSEKEMKIASALTRVALERSLERHVGNYVDTSGEGKNLLHRGGI